MKAFLAAVLMCVSLSADQPFEPLFATGGVAPLVRETGFPHIVQLRSGEQFVGLVGKAPMPVVVKIDSVTRPLASEQTAVLAGLVDEWPTPLRGCTVDARSQEKLAGAIIKSVGQRQVIMPTYVLFHKGKAVTPLLHGDQSPELLRTEVAKRLAYVQQHELPGWYTVLQQWWRSLYSGMQDFVRRMWTTLVRTSRP
ncbi:MAG: hypothetical protein PVJ92_00890 [Candidatus Dependentiae bacterium]|jgi:hypothetical protein